MRIYIRGLAIGLEWSPLYLIQHVVFAIAGTFLYHVDHFRRYSTFCASHHKVKVILGKLQQRLTGWTKSHAALANILLEYIL